VGRKTVGVLVTLLFLIIVSPMVFPLIMGVILGVLFMPTLQRLEARRVSTGLSAALLTVGITLVVLLPTAIIVFIGARAGVMQLQILKQAPSPAVGVGGDWVSTILANGRVEPVLNWITRWFPVDRQSLVESADSIIRSIGARLADWMGQFLTQIPVVVMGLSIVVVTIYFTLVDGRKLTFFLRQNSVFNPPQTDKLFRNLAVMCRSVILATFVSGGAQAAVEVIFCLLTGAPSPLLIGVFVFLGSFVPVVGSAPITFGVAALMLAQGHTGPGITLVIGAFVVAFLDNLIRPAFLKGSAGLHPLLAFVAAFGGLQVMGFLGVFLGPIIASLFVFTMQILAEGPGEDNSGAQLR
jgi:predicted PurR-regulated permease PerM